MKSKQPYQKNEPSFENFPQKSKLQIVESLKPTSSISVSDVGDSSPRKQLLSKDMVLTWKKVDVELTNTFFTRVNSMMQGSVFQEKKLLHGVNGYAHSGEMTAIVGPSGSGKTSLLNVIAQRYSTNF